MEHWRAMPAAPPAIRGFMCKLFLEAARALPPESRRQVFVLVPEPVLTLIDTSPRLGWVPAEEGLKLADALHQVLGGPGFRAFFSHLAERTMASPLMESFFAGAVRLFGLTPQSLLKWYPQAWEQVFRGCGRPVYQPLRETTVNGRVEMLLEDFPPALLRSNTFPDCVAGSFDMLLRRGAREGRVELREVDRLRGRLRYDISWE